jgi:hypothetical protein
MRGTANMIGRDALGGVAAVLITLGLAVAPSLRTAASELGPSTITDPPISFTRLRNGDTLWVEYSTSGCSHGYRAEIMILGRIPSIARVSVWRTYVRLRAEPDVYSVRLSRLDRRGLDSLLSVYRTAKPFGCTTYDEIRVSMSRRGLRFPPLVFVDGSCEADKHRGVVRFAEIVGRR